MSKLAIGMIETMGLAAGIEAADICLKSANINLVGYEFAKGSGMTVVKIEGNVGAVKAAISAATAALGKLGKVHAQMVIPRPSNSIEMLIRNEDTVGYEIEKDEILQDDIKDEAFPNENNDLNQEYSEEESEYSEKETEDSEEKTEEDLDNNSNEESTKVVDEEEEVESDLEDESEDSSEETSKPYTCNICKDPECPRQKGDLRIYCIHYKENKEKDNKDK